MSTWLSDIANSHRLQLSLTAVASCCLGVAAVIGLQQARRQYEVSDLKGSIPDVDEPHTVERINSFGGAKAHSGSSLSAEEREDERSRALARRARLGDYDEALILEQLARNRVFLTDEGLAKVRKAFVIVVGCGGVGSHAAAALARSGVGRLRLIDFDQVTLSSLNRHAVATLADVGISKVNCLQRRLEQIVPWTQYDSRNELFGAATAATQLGPWASDGQKPTFVIDAIDNIDSKVALLHYCHTNGLPVIASMGAGCKSDPTRVFIGDIATSTDDPLSRATRRKLRIAGVSSGIPTVFSTEKTGPGKASLQPLSDEEFQKGAVNELGVLPTFRVRILPVLGTMPAVFGFCLANHILLSIADYPGAHAADNSIAAKAREKMYDGILTNLQALEERLARHRHRVDNPGAPGDPRSTADVAVGLRIPVTASDVGYLVEEVFRGRSAVSGLASRLALVRWRAPPADKDDAWIDRRVPGQKAVKMDLGDLVCMTKDEVLRHEKLVLSGEKTPEEVYDKDVLDLVEKRQREERAFREQRG